MVPNRRKCNIQPHRTGGILTSAREKKPDPAEYLPYYGRYISLVPDGDVLSTLAREMRESQAILAAIPAAVGSYRYAPEKWSVNEMIGHMIDTERIFSVRALRFSRGDTSPLPGFEQDDYVRNASFDSYPLSELAAELETVRRSTLFLFRHLTEDAWMRKGVASNAEITVRALAYIIAGHELHHRGILRSRYL
jgi:hypothetical protein